MTTRRITVLVLCCLAVGVAVNSAAAVVLWHKQSLVVDDNCRKIGTVVSVGGDLIAAGRGDVQKFREEGTLTQAQANRSLRQINRRLNRWRSADCRPGRP